MKTLNKIIITRMEGRILTMLVNGNRAVQLNLEESPSILGNIYIGKVRNIAANIHSAFIDLGGGKIAYYNLEENRSHLFTDSLGWAQARAADGGAPGRDAAGAADGSPENQASCPASRSLRIGDEIVVQISQDAVKTKDPVATSRISLTGHYCVLTAGRGGIGFSSKIPDGRWKCDVRNALSKERDREFGIIVRTNAALAALDEVVGELRELKSQYYRILSEAAYRTCFTRLYKAESSYVSSLRDTYENLMDEVVTDDADIFRELREYLSAHQTRDLEKVRFYEDPLLPLGKLYSVEKAVGEAMARRVWLKSGGYLVIDPVEAMTVIDVNSGKYAGKKTLRETILKINLEAAEEIAIQLRLRNLSGIILIDFIDMAFQADRDELMEFFSSCCMKDPVKTKVVDMTQLGLVEVTRKKVRKPFREQMQKGDEAR